MAPGVISDEVPTNGTHSANETKYFPITNGHTKDKDETVANVETSKVEKKPKEDTATNGETSKVEEKFKEEAVTNGDTLKAEEKLKEGSESKESTDKKEDEPPEDDSMKCEIKHLDRRYDDKDEQYFVERKNDIEKPKQKDWWRLFAFCIVRHYDSDNELDYTRLYVNPKPLRELLFDVIGNYPSDPIDVDDVQIESPYHSLFHYREKLESEGLKRFENDEESLGQLKLLMSWIKTHFELDLIAHARCVSGDLKAISYDRLWTLFPPETIVYSKLLEKHRAFRVRESWYETGEMPGLGLKVKFIDFDGERVGSRKMELFIPKYTGTQELSELPTMPLDMLDDCKEVREELTARGRKFETYIGQQYEQYDGVALKKTQQGYARYNVTGRVMIDCKTYHRLEPNDSFSVKELVNDEAAKKERARLRAAGNTGFVTKGTVHDKLSEEDVLLTNATVRGYSFTIKKFLEFFTDQLVPIEWNSSCFDDLVLDAGTKKTVQALVSTHSMEREGFDDIVKGKGQGLVCVLHGPPGVGKTLTAGK
jgi:flagellar biosynthesis GTPase FlhF